ncbi:type III secretion system export apparatus subunit SctT [Prosthecomicrobium sp. N25]|uniref:type III secretion system export apparatus subunit SctT n=1 Tax=Prosthecomicrobium sp. N25 TaxID=3129254 RepID=UPI0030783A38
MQEAFKVLTGFLDEQFIALLLTWPRIQAFLLASQILNPTAVPRLARTAAVLALSIHILPVNLDYAARFDRTVPSLALHFFKEFAIGFLLGTLIGWIFWVVQASAALIDNQRGAAIASSVDPLHGHETSPLGILFAQAFLTYMFITGAVLPIIGILYQSYVAWPIDRGLPLFGAEFPRAMLAIFDHSMRLMFLLAAPIVAVMFMAEFALAMVSRFAPQIQVFVLAMPIKSGLAIFMLIFYFSILLPYAAKESERGRSYIQGFYSLLEGAWGVKPPAGPPEAPR